MGERCKDYHDKGLSKITIETKGKKPVEYTYYDDSWFSLHNGRQDSLSNIVSDIYGYEDQYYIFPKDTVDKVTNDLLEHYKDVPDSIMTSDLIKMENDTKGFRCAYYCL